MPSDRPGVTGPAPPAIVRPLRHAGAVLTYEARDGSGEPIVVKRLDPALAAVDIRGAQRFRREMRVACLLDHPSLARCGAWGDDWIAFEHLGAALANPAVASRHAGPAAVRKLLQQLADVLAYVHARGIVHGDLKPAHVLFRGETPVLIDFGIANLAFDDPLAAGELAGTPAWMAPEQIGGGAGPAADVWSLSALCLWLLTTTRPFSGDGDEILEKRRRGALPEFDLAVAEAQQDPGLLALLLDGLGPPERRPTAGGIVRALSVRR